MPQMYQQAPSLTPPISAPSLNEAEVPVLGSEEESVPPPGPPIIEPMAMEEPCLNMEEPASIPTTVPVPVPLPVVAPEFPETDAVEMTPAAAPSEIAQVEPTQGDEVAAVVAVAAAADAAVPVAETPTGKRPRTKKPKSAAKAGKSKAKKEADSWVDGEALSSAGADTNDEVSSSTNQFLCSSNIYIC